jgi:hypothetical protein
MPGFQHWRITNQGLASKKVGQTPNEPLAIKFYILATPLREAL